MAPLVAPFRPTPGPRGYAPPPTHLPHFLQQLQQFQQLQHLQHPQQQQQKQHQQLRATAAAEPRAAPPRVATSCTTTAGAAAPAHIMLPSSRAEEYRQLPGVCGDVYLARELEHEETMVDLLTSLIERYAANATVNAANLPDWNHPASVFFSVKIPDISVRSYVSRLCKYAQCSPAAFVVALVYMNRLASRDQTLVLSQFNLHRLLITCLCVGAKFLEDRCYSNAHYARVGGIPSVREMNRLEIQLLKISGYKLFVSVDEFMAMQKELVFNASHCSPHSVIPDHMPSVGSGHASLPYSPVTSSPVQSSSPEHQQDTTLAPNFKYPQMSDTSAPVTNTYVDSSTQLNRAPGYNCAPCHGAGAMPPIIQHRQLYTRDEGFYEARQQQQVHNYNCMPQAPSLYRHQQAPVHPYVRPVPNQTGTKPRSYIPQGSSRLVYGRGPATAMQNTGANCVFVPA
jgi:hypothetical protein